MHKDGFGATLRKYAARVPIDQSIVEVGAWLGGGTYHLADGSDGMVHVYDRWFANGTEVEKAIARGEDGLRISESFKHLVERNLRDFGDRIHLHQISDVRRSVYEGPPIGLYVDDASKNVIAEVLERFEPHFAGGCMVLLMDYFWDPCDVQRAEITRRGWEFIGRDEFDPNCAIWRFNAF